MDESNSDEKPSARHRSPTFSKKEVKALLNMVDKYKYIILNKSTSAVACQAKENAWAKIAKVFNSQGFEHVRSMESLKIKWDNLKKEARKLSKNLIDMNYSEFNDINGQIVAMICEAEKNPESLEEVKDVDDQSNESEGVKTNTRYQIVPWLEEGDNKDSEVSGDEVETENGRMLRSDRSMNFSPQECSILLQCVRQEKDYVFSKDQKSGAINMKNSAWSRITDKYNRQSPKKRSTKVLRTKFLNMKRMAKKVSFKKYLTEFGDTHNKLIEESDKKIKCEPEFEYKANMDAENDDNDDDNFSNDINERTNRLYDITNDPLSTVLNGDTRIGSMNQMENKDIVKLKLDLLKYKMETAKLKRKRVEDALQADEEDREARATERSLRLRAARLEAVAAQLKLPTAHPALAYTTQETRAQHYLHQYHDS